MSLRLTAPGRDAGQVGQKSPLWRLTAIRRIPWCVSKGLDHLLGLAASQQAVIDKDAGQPVADGAVHQRRRHRAVHAAAQPADYVPARPHLAHECARRSRR
jgi:hypothetical protein